jgi:penicillin-binding protein 1B
VIRPRWLVSRRFLAYALGLLLLAGLAGGLLAWRFYLQTDELLTGHFAGQRWDFPSRIYSDQYAVYPGLGVDGELFAWRLKRRGYVEVRDRPEARGEYRYVAADGELGHPRRLELFLRSFDFPGRREAGRLLDIRLDAGGRILGMHEGPGGEEIYSFFLEPVMLAGLHGELREDRREMKIAEVPAHLVRAVVSVEDRRFFEHRGVDLRGLARAFLVNLRSGRVRQGGSTLTQQLMKNFFLDNERTLTRKAREAVMAVMAERRFSKLEILENYLNEIYLGQKGGVGVHGMWEASAWYFGREPRELSLGQAAMLAGVIRAPNYYSPHRHPERAIERRNVVLRVLFDVGEIDHRTYRRALAEPLGTVPPVAATGSASHFTDFVRNELKENFPAEVLKSEGYSIFTTLDAGFQHVAERAVAEELDRLERDFPTLLREQGDRIEGALVVLNPRTGRILAMVGGRDYGRTQFNRVLNARRQTGSVFKPVVMLAAVGSEEVGRVHLLPTSRVTDEPFTWDYDGKQWSPANYSDKLYGEVTVREALERSINTATARIARDVGIEEIRDLAVRLGVDEALRPWPAISLGAYEISPFDVARVYSVFAGGGMKAEPLGVAKVVDRTGKVIEGNRLEFERVIPAVDAYLVTHMLEGVMERGTGRRARTAGFTRPAAGKTGTSNDYNDAWFAGYTPGLLAVAWVGFDKAGHVGLSGATAALPVWTRFMKEALEDRPPSAFQVPAGIELVEVDPLSGLLATVACNDTITEAFLEDDVPTQHCGALGHLLSRQAEPRH